MLSFKRFHLRFQVLNRCRRRDIVLCRRTDTCPRLRLSGALRNAHNRRMPITAAKMFSALGDITRARIFRCIQVEEGRFLFENGAESDFPGVPAIHLRNEVGIPNSKESLFRFHVQTLEECGLVLQKGSGREKRLVINQDSVQFLVDFLGFDPRTDFLWPEVARDLRASRKEKSHQA